MATTAPPQRRAARARDEARLQGALRQVDAGAAALKRHASPARKAHEASRAAKAPPNERRAGAQARAVDRLRDAPTPPPRPASFKALLRAEIARAMPKTLGETESFLAPGQAAAMKRPLQAQVAGQTAEAAGPVQAAQRTPPNPGAVPEAPSTPLPAEPTPARPAVDGAAAMPAPAPETEVSLQASRQETAARLAEADLQPAQLQRAQDPRFAAVVQAQAQVAAQAERAPGQYRAREAPLLAGARAQAAGTAQRGGELLVGVRARGHGQVRTRQQQQAAHEQAERQRVAAHVEAIYARTQARVQQRLAGLEGEVSALFDAGVEAALQAMKHFVDARLRAYKWDRYLSIPVVGAARWVRDQFVGLPSEVDAFYAEGRAVFQRAMDALIDRVAALVEGRLAQAKAEVAAGQAEIRGYVGALPAGLRAAGQAAERAVGERFAELSRGIDAQREQLASGLAQRYREACARADQALQSIRDENRGLVQGFVEKLAAVVQAIREFKARLSAALRNAEATIALILRDPGAFLSNLLAALKGGFNRFVDNIWQHLKAGFLNWLFGSLAAVGVTLPPDFSLGSILRLVLQVLGLTYDRIRARAVRLVGERAVGVVERVAGYLKDLYTGGPARLWEHLKDDLADLKAMVVDAIQDWLITTLIRQAVLKIVSMFNPVGAIVQVVLTIVNVVMFVVEQAQRILALVESVIRSVAAIATGAIGAAVTRIERALADAVPVVIGFLARLLGLSGLTQKIQQFIRNVQARVEAAVDKALTRIVGMFRAAGSAVAGAARRLVAWWKQRKAFSVGAERHELFFAGKGSGGRLRVASDEMDLDAFVQAIPPARRKTLATEIKTVRDAQAEIRRLVSRRAPDPKQPDEAADGDDRIQQQFDVIAAVLPRLMAGGEWGTKASPILMLAYPKKALTLYRPLYLGPRLTGPVKQQTLAEKAANPARPADLPRLAHQLPQQAAAKTPDPSSLYATPIAPNAIDAWLARGGRILRYLPFEQRPWPGNQSVEGSTALGVAPGFRVQSGSAFPYEPGDGTKGGRLINRALSHFGYRSGTEEAQGDHVLEVQLITFPRANVLPNLWPLLRNQNQHGLQLKDCAVELPGGADPALDTLDKAWNARRKRPSRSAELWVMIRSTREVG